MREMRNVHGAESWLGNLKGRDHLGDLDIDGRVLQKCILKKSCKDVHWIKLAQNRDNCEHVNEPSGSQEVQNA
jgi:hypothetical protein